MSCTAARIAGMSECGSDFKCRPHAPCENGTYAIAGSASSIRPYLRISDKADDLKWRVSLLAAVLAVPQLPVGGEFLCGASLVSMVNRLVESARSVPPYSLELHDILVRPYSRTGACGIREHSPCSKSAK